MVYGWSKQSYLSILTCPYWSGLHTTGLVVWCPTRTATKTRMDIRCRPESSLETLPGVATDHIPGSTVAMSTSTTNVQTSLPLQTRPRSATHSSTTEGGARVIPSPAVGSLSRSPLFRSNSLDRFREKRRLRRQWERRHSSNDSNADSLSGNETGPEDNLNMVETDEPMEFFSSLIANNGSSSSLSGRRYEFEFSVPNPQ